MVLQTCLWMVFILHALKCQAWMLMDSEQNYISPKETDNIREAQKNIFWSSAEETTCPNFYPRYPYKFGLKPHEQGFQYKCKRSIPNQSTFINEDEIKKPSDILQNSQNTVTEQEDSHSHYPRSHANNIPPEARDNQIPQAGDNIEDVIANQTHVPKTETNLHDLPKVGTSTLDATQPIKGSDEPYIVKAVPTDKASTKKLDVEVKPNIEESSGIPMSLDTSGIPESHPTTDSTIATGGHVAEDVSLKRQDTLSEGEEKKKVPEVIDQRPVENVSPELSSKTKPESEQPSSKQKEGNDTEPEEFASFRQWTLRQEEKKRAEERKKKEEEKEKKMHIEQQLPKTSDTNGRETHQQSVSIRMKKNFASTDCGAKVISANIESQGSGNIITTSKDEYMLNKCTDKGWFVVELCESIKAHKIEMANFELFSSVFKNFRVSLGSLYPGKDKVWSVFGDFEGEELRDSQTFENVNGVFGKYVKVEISSHYGTEHYCPVSLFKIYGISEIELMDDDDSDDHDTAQQISNAGESKPPESNNMITIIQRKVGETIEGLKGVFTAQDQVRDSVEFNQDYNSTLFGTTFKYHIICPGCDKERLQETRLLVSEDFEDLLQTLKKPSLRFELTNQICSSYGFNLNSRLQGTCLGDQLVEFFKVLFGTSRIIALCNVIAWQEGRLVVAKNPPELTLTKVPPLSQNRENIEPSKSVELVKPTKLDVASTSTESLFTSMPLTQSGNTQNILNAQTDNTQDAKDRTIINSVGNNIGENLEIGKTNIIPTPVTKGAGDVSVSDMELNGQGQGKANENANGKVSNMYPIQLKIILLNLRIASHGF